MSNKLVTLEVVEMAPMPANCNPFHHDHHNMGTSLPDSWMVMHGDDDERFGGLKYLNLVNTATGQAFKIIINAI